MFSLLSHRWKWHLEWRQNSRRLLDEPHAVGSHITIKKTLIISTAAKLVLSPLFPGLFKAPNLDGNIRVSSGREAVP